MTDVTKVGGAPPQTVNRPNPPQKDAKTGAGEQTGTAERTSETFRLPGVFSDGENNALTAAEALKAVFTSLTEAFAEAEENPPATGGALEDLLSEIKVAAPFLDRVLAARKEELLAEGDTAGLQELDAKLADAETAVADARAGLEAAANALPDEEVAEDPAVTAALNAILGEDREIPEFSADELREGRQEFISLVFDDIADAIGRHRNDGAQTASFTLNALGGTNLTA